MAGAELTMLKDAGYEAPVLHRFASKLPRCNFRRENLDGSLTMSACRYVAEKRLFERLLRKGFDCLEDEALLEGSIVRAAAMSVTKKNGEQSLLLSS